MNQRFRTDRKYNLQLLDGVSLDRRGYPVCEYADAVPKRLIPFNEALGAKDTDGFIHFYVDDYQFERLWNNPERYDDALSRFDGVLSPDFSCYIDMPRPMQAWNEYRRRLLATHWAKVGIDVIPTLCWSTPDNYDIAFGGFAKGGTYAISTVGVTRRNLASVYFTEGLTEAVRTIKPKRLLVYGKKPDINLGCEMIYFEANTNKARMGREVEYGR